MKAFKLIFALLLSAAFVFSFTSCSNGGSGSGNDEPPALATFATTSGGTEQRFLFYDDNTFALKSVLSANVMPTALTGTYTGNPNKASETITLTLKKVGNSSGTLTDVTDSNLPSGCSNPTTITISSDGNSFSFMSETYTKK